VSRTLVAELLNTAGYSLQGNRKTKEGDSHPDRDAQFARINTQVAAALAEQQPVISVDTKKKELVGDFRNNGREYRPQGNPKEVRVHDFLIKSLPSRKRGNSAGRCRTASMTLPPIPGG
jgi:Rhodopirellula transposase DDE domain